jgi:hypothetical protein
VQGGYGTCFCRHGTNFIEHYECRGTSLINGRKAVSVAGSWKIGTGAVSRYKFDRSKKIIKVQKPNCEQMSESGCNGHYEIVLGAGAKAKTVTNQLTFIVRVSVPFVY